MQSGNVLSSILWVSALSAISAPLVSIITSIAKALALFMLRLFHANLFVVSSMRSKSEFTAIRNRGIVYDCDGLKYGLIIGYPYIGLVYKSQVSAYTSECDCLYLVTTDAFFDAIRARNIDHYRQPSDFMLYLAHFIGNKRLISAIRNRKYAQNNRYVSAGDSSSNETICVDISYKILLETPTGIRRAYEWKLKFPFTPTQQQSEVINRILNRFNTSPHNTCVCYLYGPPRTGKSAIANFIGARTSGTVTDFNFVRTTMSLVNAYAWQPSINTCPLIFRCDEVDATIQNIIDAEKKHEPEPTIQVNKHSMNEATSEKIQSKRGWTQIFDRISDGTFPNTIFILTSNISPEEFDKVDPAFLRPGRINFRYELTDTIDM